VDFIKTSIFYCSNPGRKSYKLASQADKYPFSTLGPSQGNKVVDFKKLFFFPTLTQCKTLGLIS